MILHQVDITMAHLIFLLLCLAFAVLEAFNPSSTVSKAVVGTTTCFSTQRCYNRASKPSHFRLLDTNDGLEGSSSSSSSTSSNMDGVVELADSNTASSSSSSTQAAAPFLSQGDIDPEALNPDLSDPKQARVIIYIILSLLPVLFLIPLMLGSRELIPLETLPPVQL